MYEQISREENAQEQRPTQIETQNTENQNHKSELNNISVKTRREKM